jgi:hypothetical protein
LTFNDIASKSRSHRLGGWSASPSVMDLLL